MQFIPLLYIRSVGTFAIIIQLTTEEYNQTAYVMPTRQYFVLGKVHTHLNQSTRIKDKSQLISRFILSAIIGKIERFQILNGLRRYREGAWTDCYYQNL